MSLEAVLMMGAIVLMGMVIAARAITVRMLMRDREGLWQLHGEVHKRFNEHRRRQNQREIAEQERLALSRKKIALQKKLLQLEQEIEDWGPEGREHTIHYVLFKDEQALTFAGGAELLIR